MTGKWVRLMTKCPTCNLAMDSHSNLELIECCMKQTDDKLSEKKGICPNCMHEIKSHSNKELAECAIAYLKSEISDGT